VVVDDGSKDGSGEIALAAGAVVLRHPVNLGAGAAQQTGIDYALSRGAEIIVTFDADGQHMASDIDALVADLQKAGTDFALGNRFTGHVENMPLMRRIVLKLAVLFTVFSTGLKMSDAHNGLRAMTAEAARKIRFRQNRMAHGSEIIEQIARLKLSYVETPVTVRYTDYSLKKGQSSLNAINILFELISERILK